MNRFGEKGENPADWLGDKAFQRPAPTLYQEITPELLAQLADEKPVAAAPRQQGFGMDRVPLAQLPELRRQQTRAPQSPAAKPPRKTMTNTAAPTLASAAATDLRVTPDDGRRRCDQCSKVMRKDSTVATCAKCRDKTKVQGKCVTCEGRLRRDGKPEALAVGQCSGCWAKGLRPAAEARKERTVKPEPPAALTHAPGRVHRTPAAKPPKPIIKWRTKTVTQRVVRRVAIPPAKQTLAQLEAASRELTRRLVEASGVGREIMRASLVEAFGNKRSLS